MDLSDPQFYYMIFVLPGLFGMTLLGDGLHKFANNDSGGKITIFVGLLFLTLVAVGGVYFSTL